MIIGWKGVQKVNYHDDIFYVTSIRRLRISSTAEAYNSSLLEFHQMLFRSGWDRAFVYF